MPQLSAGFLIAIVVLIASLLVTAKEQRIVTVELTTSGEVNFKKNLDIGPQVFLRADGQFSQYSWSDQHTNQL